MNCCKAVSNGGQRCLWYHEVTDTRTDTRCTGTQTHATQTRKSTRAQTRRRAEAQAYPYPRTHTLAHKHMHTHKYTHAHTHAHTHTGVTVWDGSPQTTDYYTLTHAHTYTHTHRCDRMGRESPDHRLLPNPLWRYLLFGSLCMASGEKFSKWQSSTKNAMKNKS